MEPESQGRDGSDWVKRSLRGEVDALTGMGKPEGLLHSTRAA